jgi:hypothetical protein
MLHPCLEATNRLFAEAAEEERQMRAEWIEVLN